MMRGSRDAATLRAALSKHREQKRYGKYPSELSARAVVYAQARSRSGATAAEVASELGVREATAAVWTTGREPSTADPEELTPKASKSLPLVPVLVRSERRDMPSMRFKIAFPDGTRMQVSGIAGRDLAEAIEALRRTR